MFRQVTRIFWTHDFHGGHAALLLERPVVQRLHLNLPPCAAFLRTSLAVYAVVRLQPRPTAFHLL